MKVTIAVFKNDNDYILETIGFPGLIEISKDYSSALKIIREKTENAIKSGKMPNKQLDCFFNLCFSSPND